MACVLWSTVTPGMPRQVGVEAAPRRRASGEEPLGDRHRHVRWPGRRGRSRPRAPTRRRRRRGSAGTRPPAPRPFRTGAVALRNGKAYLPATVAVVAAVRVQDVVPPVVEDARPDGRLLDGLVGLRKLLELDRRQVLGIRGRDLLVLVAQAQLAVLPEEPGGLDVAADAVDVDVLDRRAAHERDERQRHAGVEEVGLEKAGEDVAALDSGAYWSSSVAERIRPKRLR